MMRDACEAALRHRNVAALLRVIRAGETGQTDAAYRTLFDAPPWQHPRQAVTAAGLTSTAAGAYQFLSSTWDECAAALKLPDFSPASQDLAAVYLIQRRGAIGTIQAGDVESAVRACASIWASLPGSPYGQPTIPMSRCREVYAEYGGTFAADAAPTPQPTSAPADAPTAPPVQPAARSQPEKRMPIFLSALLQLIPGLITVFGKNSEQSQKNAATFNVVADQVVKAVPGATDLPTAISAMVADPAVKAQAEAQVMASPAVLALIEVGGGIVEARKRDDAAVAAPGWYRPLLTPSFLISLLLLGFVGCVLYNVATDAGGLWRPEDRSQVLMLAVAVVSAVMGYYLGSSLGSANKDRILSKEIQ